MLLLLLLLAVPARAEAVSQVSADFDGNGREDLAVGVPFEDVGSYEDAGSVNVIYGRIRGLTPSGDQLWYHESEGISGGLQTQAFFGFALGAGDFDGDGYGDLAVGSPMESVPTSEGSELAGAVHVIYGSAEGLSATENEQLWFGDNAGDFVTAEEGQWFGGRLAAGDFNGDEHDDLAIGVTEREYVVAVWGSSGGLVPGARVAEAIPNEHGESFGQALAAGDFDADGNDDLAIGVPAGTLFPGGTFDAGGRVEVLYGSEEDFDQFAPREFWSQDSSGVKGGGEYPDYFGFALAAGNFDDDSADDLAIGVPGEGLGQQGPINVGAVNVIYGSIFDLQAGGDQLWHQDKPGIRGATNGGDAFGAALSAGDFDSDGHEDLAVGVHLERAFVEGGGAVNVIRGSAERLDSEFNQLWHQDSEGIRGKDEPYDGFGSSLSAADFNGNGRDDLAIGVRGEDIGTTADAGVANVLYGSAANLVEAGDQLWHQGRVGIAGDPESDDGFGFVVQGASSPASAYWLP